MTQDIFLIREDTDLMHLFQKELEKNGTRIAPFKSAKLLTKKGGAPYSMVVIDTDGDWARELKTLQKMKKEGKEFYAIVSSASMLKKTVTQIHETALSLNSLNEESPVFTKKRTGQEEEQEKGRDHELNLAELVEKKLTLFVQKIKNCKAKNLYSLLIQEFEKPLITLALKETEGNQIQAAQLLGMNRNTLRKKMRELKISIVKNKKPH